jgi:hypothetical protein
MYEVSILIIGLFFGWIIRVFTEALKMQRLYNRIMRDIQAIEFQENFLNRVFKTCYIEKNSETYFLYDSESSKFLCQGKDYEQLAKCLYTEHDIQIAVVRETEKDHLWFDHGTIKNAKVI